MKYPNKKVISFVVAIMVTIISTAFIAATTKPPEITINLNGNTLVLDTNLRTINGRILVPVSSLSKELGATTEWVDDTKSVIITLPTKDKIKTIYFKIGQASALVDGVEVNLDAAATIYQNRTFIPLRFVAEYFGATVEWNTKTKTVNITYTVPIQEKPPILPPPWELQERQTTGSAMTTNY